MQSLWFFVGFIKILLESIYNNFRNFISFWGLSRDQWFSRFLEHISASFWYFFMKSLLVVRSYRVLVTNIKILIIGALVTLGTRLEVPILANFWWFLAFFQFSVLTQTFWPRTVIFLKKVTSIYLLLRTIKDFMMTVTIKPKINPTQTRISKHSKNMHSDLALKKCRFQFYSSEKFEIWSASRYW